MSGVPSFFTGAVAETVDFVSFCALAAVLVVVSVAFVVVALAAVFVADVVFLAEAVTVLVSFFTVVAGAV
ncbi:hypothetical protein D3C80_880160 [compost metagenome]